MQRQISYKNLVFLGLILSVIWAVVFFIMRLFIAKNELENVSFFDSVEIFTVGFRFDMRLICIVFAVFILLGFFSFVNNLYGGGIKHKLESVFYKISLIFSGIFGFLICLFAFINFYYFASFHNRIDTTIFQLKEDNTFGILQIIFKNYPSVYVLFVCVIFSVLCVILARKILSLKLPNIVLFRRDSSLQILAIVMLNIMLLCLLFIGLRGGVLKILKEDNFTFSTNILENNIATNPFLCLHWAYKNYKDYDSFAPIRVQDLKDLESELFPVFSHNPQRFHAQQNLNVVFVLMESFASNMLMLDSKDDFDLLMSFRPSFENGKTPLHSRKGDINDFTFMNFLGYGNLTIAAFSHIFYITNNWNISKSSFKHTKLPLTPFDVYKKAGYDVVFITSGNHFWQELGEYAKTLGVDKIYDSLFLIKYFPESKELLGSDGIPDEFAYKMALEILSKAQKPTFIAILTTSNHPPYILPPHFTPPNYDLDSRIELFSDKANAKTIIKLFSYASDEFGKFLESIKADSTLSKNTIVAGSGDHYFRYLKPMQRFALNYAVPFYLYIPNILVQDFAKNGFEFNPQMLGSHKDIFPTLYALSLNDYDYLTLGGRNLFDKNAPIVYNFALNQKLYIDESGIYPFGTDIGLKYKDNDIFNDSEEFIAHKDKSEFLQKYHKLNDLQTNYRIFQGNK